MIRLALILVILVGCNSYRVPINGSAPAPIYATDSATLRDMAAQHHDVSGRVVWGFTTYDPPTIDVHWWLSRDAHAANVAHEVVHHLERVYGPGVWAVVDQFAPTTVEGLVRFPIASDHHPTRQGYSADDTSELAQRAWAEYFALNAYYRSLIP